MCVCTVWSCFFSDFKYACGLCSCNSNFLLLLLRMLGPCLFYFDYGFFFLSFFDSEKWFLIQYPKSMIDFLSLRLCFSQFSCSVVSDTLRPYRLQHAITNSQSLFKLMSIKLVMPSNHLILCRPLLLPSIFPSITVFSNKSVLRIRWPKYWSCSFSPSN